MTKGANGDDVDDADQTRGWSLGSPSPMQPSASEPGTSSRKRPEPQGAMVLFAGSSTDSPTKKARTIRKPLEAPRARVALATESCVMLSVVLPQSQKLVELELKLMENSAGVAVPRPPIKLDLSEHNDESVLVKLTGLKLIYRGSRWVGRSSHGLSQL